MAKNKRAYKSSRAKKISRSRKWPSGKTRGSSIIKGSKKNVNELSPYFQDNKLRNHGQIIVRVMEKGQYRINQRTATRINALDNSIVDIVKRIITDEKEFKKKLKEMLSLVSKNGQELEHTEIVKSDILLPNSDISIDDAKNLFKGEGIIPD